MRRRRGRQPGATTGAGSAHARGREPRVDGHDGDGLARERPRRARLFASPWPRPTNSWSTVGGGTGRRGQTEHRNARRPSGVTPLDDPLSSTVAPCNLRRAARLEPHRDRTVTEVDSRTADVARGRSRGDRRRRTSTSTKPRSLSSGKSSRARRPGRPAATP